MSKITVSAWEQRKSSIRFTAQSFEAPEDWGVKRIKLSIRKAKEDFKITIIASNPPLEALDVIEGLEEVKFTLNSVRRFKRYDNCPSLEAFIPSREGQNLLRNSEVVFFEQPERRKPTPPRTRDPALTDEQLAASIAELKVEGWKSVREIAKEWRDQ